MKTKAVALFSLLALLVLAQAVLAADEQPKAKKKRAPGTIGRVKSVDATANTITLTIRERGKKAPEGAEKAKPATMDKTFKLAKDCKVTIGTEDKTLADVKADMFVSLTVSEGGEVTAIRSFEPRKKKQPNT